MAVRWYYSVNASTVLEITDRVRKPDPSGNTGFSVGSHAEEGSGWEGTINVDDELGDLVLLMHRRVYAVSEEETAGAQVIGNWFITNLDVLRGTPPVEASRIWVVTLADENSLLARRIFVGGDSNRPAETDIVRIRWLLTTTELNTVDRDEAFIDTSGPKALDATDYTGQKPDSVMEHCKKASGKNYWIKYGEAEAVGGAIVSSSVASPSVITTTTAHGLTTGMSVVIAGHSGSTPSINGTRVVTVTGASTFTIAVNVTVGGTGGTVTTIGRYQLCYFDPNTSDLYPSTISLSNVSTEINDSSVFAISDDTRLSRAGGRAPTSGVFEPYTGGYVYEQNTTVGDTYVYRDVSAPSVNVKTAAKATAAAVRELAELATPDDEVETEINVKSEDLNKAMHGMSIGLHATHLPPYTPDGTLPAYATGQDMRISRRQVRQIAPARYGVRMWLTPKETPISPRAVLWRAKTSPDPPEYIAAGIWPIAWTCSGDLDESPDDSACAGFIPEPTFGPLHTNPGSVLGSPGPPPQAPEGHYLGFTFDAGGTIDFNGDFQVFGALDGVDQAVDILIDGVVIATGTGVSGVPTPTQACRIHIEETDVPVNAGSVLTARFRHGSGGAPFYIDTPAGEEDDVDFRITGGSLFA